MGGNALTDCNCIRVRAKLYYSIKSIILKILSDYLNLIPIIEMPEKETFGDLDLMYDNDLDIDTLIGIITKLFLPEKYITNGKIFSFSYKLNETEFFEIDLIKVSNISMSEFYFGYGEVGCILGCMLKKYKLTFGQEGLWINYEDEKIILSTDPEEICSFLGLDYNKWKYTFCNPEELFDWITKCRYFNKNDFNPKSVNSKYKKFYEKRPFFKKFLDEYVPSLEIINEPINFTVLDYIIMFKKQNEKEIIDKKISIKRLHREKFNGQVFLLHTEAKNINQYKKKFKEHISLNEDEFNKYLYEHDIEFINKKIEEFILENPL